MEVARAFWALICGIARMVLNKFQEPRYYYRMTAHFGDQVKESKFFSEEGEAVGRVLKEFSWHEADRVVLEQRFGDEWRRVMIQPSWEEMR